MALCSVILPNTIISSFAVAKCIRNGNNKGGHDEITVSWKL